MSAAADLLPAASRDAGPGPAPAAAGGEPTDTTEAAGDFTIAVRELVEFTAKAGDLDLRFTPAPTAQEGIEGHRLVALRRRHASGGADGGSGDEGDGERLRAPAGAGHAYETELALSIRHGPLRLRGRADGFDPAANRLEEVKTYRGDLARLPENQRALHWAQAKLYGAMLCAERNLAELEIAVVYFDIRSQEETPVAQRFSRAELQAFLDEHCGRFLAWARQEMAHRAARDAALATLRFPHADFRHGQRLLAEAVYRAARDGACLLAQAPTGIGKTLGTLFPLLKACPTQGLDRVFFLTAKTPGRALALDALQTLATASAAQADGSAGTPGGDRPGFGPTTADAHAAPVPPGSDDTESPAGLSPGFRRDARIRVLELTARDKSCLQPDKECHGESCPLAQGFYDRLPGARAEAAATAFLDQAALQAVAQRHQLCPYYLAQEMARWSDVVVGDYNYFFDGSALLFSLTQAREWKVAVLCDEAHNLIDRAREMYSAELVPAQLAALRKTAPAVLKRPLGRLQKAWDALHDTAPPWRCLDELPPDVSGALQGAIAKISDYLGEHPLGLGPDLQRFYFDALHFQDLLEQIGPHAFIDVLSGARDVLRIRNVIPAPHLRPRIAACHTLTLFSATLTPPALHRDLLGLPPDTRGIDVPSPFAAEQLAVRIVDRISTRYAHREASLAPMADLMAGQYRAQPGNYLAFFSSHDYLQRALAAFRTAYPDIPVREQARGMDEAARRDFLAGFGEETEGIAFAVLGGAFGEGIDLPGRRLIGAFVATLGLPQVNEVNEKIRAVLQAQFGAGHDYAYLYPGLQKVVQAAGRVIRGTQDRGVVYLVDDRFAQARVRALLPAWWQVDRMPAGPGRP